MTTLGYLHYRKYRLQTLEQQDQLIDKSGVKEREDYDEGAFNIFRFEV
jgi:hypothetical protein